MITTQGYSIRQNETRHKYACAMSEYLDACDADRSTGDVESNIGYVAQFGRRLLFTDSQGFVWCDRFKTEHAATVSFDVLDEMYSAWCEDDTDA